MVIPRTPSPDVADDRLRGLTLDHIMQLARERLAEVKVSFCKIPRFNLGGLLIIV